MSAEQWRSGVVRRGADPAEVPNPMEGMSAMTAAARELSGAGGEEEKLGHLHNALLDGTAFTFEYARGSTFSAAEAFEKRRGNCVSFTNLFIAFGRSLGIRLQAALVSARGVSEREGDLIVTYNHMVAVYMLVDGRTMKVYDFYQQSERAGGRYTLLDDWAVAAIRASNDGIAHLGRGEGAEAEHDLEIAVKLAPRLGSLHANLGLVKWKNGDIPGAFAQIRTGLEIEPHSPPLLQNLAALYVEQGRPAEARAALAALDERQASPYALIVRGDLLLREGDTRGALRNYRDAAGLDPKLAAPWIAIARVELWARASGPCAQGRREGAQARARQRRGANAGGDGAGRPSAARREEPHRDEDRVEDDEEDDRDPERLQRVPAQVPEEEGRARRGRGRFMAADGRRREAALRLGPDSEDRHGDPTGTTRSSMRLPSRSGSPSAMRMSLRIVPSWSAMRSLRNESAFVSPSGSNVVRWR